MNKKTRQKKIPKSEGNHTNPGGAGKKPETDPPEKAK